MSAPATLIRPTPLSGTAIGLLLSEAIGEHLDDDTVAEAERLTEGNPLYVRELADSLTSGAQYCQLVFIPLALPAHGALASAPQTKPRSSTRRWSVPERSR
jgi:hypothetical protein